MNKWVPVSEKKKFIRWFLNEYRLKKMDSKKIFDLLITHDYLLDRVHFTDNINPNGRSVVISTVCSETIPFEYRKLTKTSQQVDEAIHDLLNNTTERIYLIIHFRGKLLSHQYLAIRENFKTEIKVSLGTPLLLQILTDIYLDQSLQKHRLAELEKEIDDCLQTGNKLRFLELTKERNLVLEELL